MTCHTRINIWDSCIIYIDLGEQSLCTFNASKRGGCTTIQNIKTFNLHQECSTSFTLILILDRRYCSTAQEICTRRVVKVIRSTAHEIQTHRVVQMIRTTFNTGSVNNIASLRTIRVDSNISLLWICRTIIDHFTITARPMISCTALETN